MINYNHLYYFYSVVKEGSISAGARKLNISQPALSIQIKKLEESLNLNLFVRHGRKIRITPSGKTLFRYSSRMFPLVEECLVALKQPIKDTKLRLGVGDEIERPFTVRLVHRVIANETSATPAVKVVSGTTPSLVSALRAGRLDALLCDRPPAKQDFHTLGVLSMPVGLVAKNVGYKTRQMSLESVLERGLVMPSSRFRLRTEIDTFLEAKGWNARLVFESDLLASVVRAVEDGVGASFLPLAYFIDSPTPSQFTVFGPAEGYWKYPLWLMSAQAPKADRPLLMSLQSAFKELIGDVESFQPALDGTLYPSLPITASIRKGTNDSDQDMASWAFHDL